MLYTKYFTEVLYYGLRYQWWLHQFGACAGECPVDAISEGDGKYVIDADACVECGACAGVCPVAAPSAE